jgi:Fe-S-cluster containining protein
MTLLPIISERSSAASKGLVNCNGCTSCCERGGLVYLHDDEVDELVRLGVPIMEVDSVAFIQRRPGGACPMLDQSNKKCSIYDRRPLCCRLFPLDLLSLARGLQWALANDCPEERKRFESKQGMGSRLGSGSIGRIADALTTYLNPEDLAYFARKERIARRLEMLELSQGEWVPLGEPIGELDGGNTAQLMAKKKESKKEKLRRKLRERKEKKKRKNNKSSPKDDLSI